MIIISYSKSYKKNLIDDYHHHHIQCLYGCHHPHPPHHFYHKVTCPPDTGMKTEVRTATPRPDTMPK